MFLVKNIFFLLVVILVGYYIIGEGFGDMYWDMKNNWKFLFNIYLLMILVVVGLVLMGSFEELVLLILIFVVVYFFEDYV